MGKPLEDGNIDFDQETLKNLNTTRRWTMFLAISGFIFIGIMIVVGLITGLFLSVFNAGMAGPDLLESLIMITLLVVTVIFFISVLHLLRFSKHITKAVHSLSNIELFNALKSLKLYFVFLGILIIIVFIFYMVALIVSGSTLAFLKGE